MEFKPIKAKKIYEEIVEQIKQLMAGGELKPGDKLLPERELADRLQVSRASVREAIRALEMMGFVEIKPGDGTFVRDTNTDDIIQPLAMFLAVEKSSLLEMFEIRRIFETATAGLAAERATDEEVNQIGTLLERMKESLNIRDSERGEELDIAFHYAVAEATHNALLIRLYRTLTEDFSLSVSIARRQLYIQQDNPQKIIDHHSRVYEAIRAHDPETASQAMLEHLTYAELEMRKRLFDKSQA
jgi:GntR family transcriptional regulator, transcriptional repressor for pyruvate dehydrogenase complex